MRTIPPRIHWIALALAGCTAGGGSPVLDALERGLPQEAWRLAGEAVAADSADAAAWTDLARAALATGRTLRGLEAAERARSLTPADPAPLLLRAYLDESRRRNVAAQAAADSARALAPESPRAVRAAGEMRLGGGMVGVPDWAGAEEAFRAAVALDSTDVRARFGLGMILVLDGRGGEAASWLDGVLAERPAWGDAHYLRGLAHMRAHDFEAARSRFEAAVAFEPAHAAASFNRARVLDRLGLRDEAAEARERSDIVRDLVERVRLAGEKWHASADPAEGVTYARTLRHVGRWEDARDLARTLVADFPRLAASHLEWAEAAWAIGDAEEARDAAERAAELAPGQARAFLVAAYAAEAAGDPEAAWRHARAAVERDPAEPEAAALLAHLLVETGRADEAIAPLDEAVRRGARDIRIAGARCEALLALDRSDEAEPLLGRMIRTQRAARWLELRARARRASGRHGPAADDLRAALELKPRSIELWRLLAEVQDNAGRSEEADECRERADRIEREDGDADRALAAWRRAPRDPSVAAHAVEELTAAGRTADAGRVTVQTDGFGMRP